MGHQWLVRSAKHVNMRSLHECNNSSACPYALNRIPSDLEMDVSANAPSESALTPA